jgi:Transport and Golgi organisation 2
MPLRLLGVRDELTDRPWRPPARHWPGLPLIGGIDDQAGGTWLAVHPGIPRVACLLNARGTFADPAARRSRGELPLRAAADGPGVLGELAGDPAALAAYDPFILICATANAVTVLTWPGPVPADGLTGAAIPEPPATSASAAHAAPAVPAALGVPGVSTVRELTAGTHLFTNAGHAYPAGPGDPAADPKAVHFAEKFAAARPSADPALGVASAWGDWLTLAAGDGLDPGEPAAIVARRDLPDGRVWGSTSVTLVALAADALRYDFQPRPGDPDGWYPVALP